jgi:ribose transport system substrate-binding protein
MTRALMRILSIAALSTSACTSAAVPAVNTTAPAPTAVAPTASPTLAKEYVIDFAQVSDVGPVFVTTSNGVDKAAAVVGAKVRKYVNGFDPVNIQKNAQLMVQARPDLIIEWNPVEGIGASLGKIFSDAKIPCIAVNTPIPGCHRFKIDAAKMGRDTAAVVAPIMRSKGWTGENTTIIVLQAAVAGPELNEGPRNFYSTLAESVSGYEKIAASSIDAQMVTLGKAGLQLDGKGTIEGGYAAVKNALQTIPTSRNLVLYGLNDDSVLGGWRAIGEAGRQSTSLAAGASGTPDGINQLRTNPQWVAQADQLPAYWGQFLMAMAAAILQGATPPPLTPAPLQILTKQTLPEVYPAGSTEPSALPPLLPEHHYLVGTGVLQKFNNVKGLSK